MTSPEYSHDAVEAMTARAIKMFKGKRLGMPNNDDRDIQMCRVSLKNSIFKVKMT